MKLRSFLKSLVVSSTVLATCNVIAAPNETVLGLDHPGVRAVIAIQDELTPGLMQLPGVLGTAVGVEEGEETRLVVFIDQDSPARADLVRALPPRWRGVGVTVHLTEKFQAVRKPGGGTTPVSHTALQTPPIQMGTSGGWTDDLANGYCCGGTLGSLVQVNGVQYILSNYHVFESDTVPGGNGIIATSGDAVIQPGLIDVGCTAGYAQPVASLVKIESLPNSNVDAAIAQVAPGMASSSILEVSPISGTTVGAKLRQAVKKSGRTTGLTRSKVTALNATVSVTYANECAGGAAFTKTFTGQIIIANSNSAFLAGGDSGSLLLEDVSTKPRAVGLLYAGSNTSAVANPINQVLSYIGSVLGGTATMVGN